MAGDGKEDGNVGGWSIGTGNVSAAHRPLGVPGGSSDKDVSHQNTALAHIAGM